MALRGTKAHHRAMADREMDKVQGLVVKASTAIQEGSCTRAYLTIADIWETIGRSEAHGREAGRTAWQPTSYLQDLGYQFSERCLRDTPTTLGAGRRPRRRHR